MHKVNTTILGGGFNVYQLRNSVHSDSLVYTHRQANFLVFMKLSGKLNY